jgi:glycosyltransferase A (GT-A) superfamily protein (DUF2064 family)
METAIIIFSKAPIPGLVKTRLTEDTCLNEKDTAIIAEAMLKDTIKLASESSANKIIIGFYPEEGLKKFEEVVEKVRSDGFLDKNVLYFLQHGSNFDERFGFVINEAFENGIDILIVLGADLPFMDPNVIKTTFEYLTTKIYEKPIVLGPSSGGGIYLVGVSKDFNPEWFTEHQLFRGGVELSQFVLFCKEFKFKLLLLPPYGDVDIEEDLVSLITYIDALSVSKNSVGFHFPYYTAKILEDLGLYIVEEQNQTRRRKIAKK